MGLSVNILKESISLRLRSVEAQIQQSAQAVGRSSSEIQIVAVSKLHPWEAVAAAVQSGSVHIGENRVQEAEEKFPQVKEYLNSRGFDVNTVRWHMVGRLQSNKTRRAAKLFDVIQSVDSIKLATRLSKSAVELDKLLDIFVEINTSGEETKGGLPSSYVEDFIVEIVEYKNLRVAGLMTIGPLTGDQSRIRASFEQLGSLRESICRSVELPSLKLSMGMSGDYPLAIQCGSDTIRIGTSIFGERTEAKRAGVR